MADWIILDKTTGIGSDEVTITVSSYSELVERLKNLVFTTTDNKASDTCVVRQYGESGYLKVIPSSINMVYGGGYVDVTVSSTEDWTIGGLPSWITCNSLGGKKGDTVIRLTISANTAASERSYNISFTSANYNATLNVKQAKYEEGSIIPPSINPDDCEGGTFTVRITGDGCWSFKPDEPSPSPICDDALVWGTYVLSTIDKATPKLTINGKGYTPTVDGNTWALCSWNGGTMTILKDFMNNEIPYGTNYKQYASVIFQDLDTSQVTDMSGMFYCCYNLKSLNLSTFNTSNVKNMSGMFKYCWSLTSLDVSSFNTSNVTNMRELFRECSKINSLDLSNFNTSKVTDMYCMFMDCSKLTSLDLSGWDTGNVTDMSGMFGSLGNLTTIDLSSFNTSNVTLMNSMFDHSSFTSLDLSSFNTSKVTGMNFMFNECEDLVTIDVSNWNTENVRNMGNMFGTCSKLTTLDLSSFNTSNVRSMSGMFKGCSSLASLDLSNFTVMDNPYNTAELTYVDLMFKGCNSLKTVKVINCDSTTQRVILKQLQEDLSHYTWTLSNGIITRS